MSMPGRSYEAQSGYRYGFNGKEKDKDLNSLTAYDYGFRIYNPGIGKFLSVDPLINDYPMLTPYQFASNNPIEGVDLDGLEYTSSKSPYISPYIKYDPTLKKITEVTTSLIYCNFMGFSRSKLLPKYGPSGANWETYREYLLIDYAKVFFETVSKEGAIETVLTKTLSDKDMLEDQRGGGKNFVYTSPTVNKQRKASATFNRINGKQGVKVNDIQFANGDKMGAAISVIGFVAVGVAALMSSDEFTYSKNQSNFIMGIAANKIIEWVDKGQIPTKYLNDKNLTEIASFLLNGAEPKLITPAGEEKVNNELLNIAKGIWSEISDLQKDADSGIQVEKRNLSMSSAGSTDNTTVKPTVKPITQRQ